jgi:hypothetical protein
MVVFALEVDGLDVGRAANRRGRHPEGQKQFAHTGTHFTTAARFCANQATSRMVETTPKVEAPALWSCGPRHETGERCVRTAEVPVPIEEPILTLNAVGRSALVRPILRMGDDPGPILRGATDRQKTP